MVAGGFFGDCRYLRMTVGGCGWLQGVVDGCRWLQMVVGGCGCLWVVAYFSITLQKRAFTLALSTEHNREEVVLKEILWKHRDKEEKQFLSKPKF